MSFEALALAAAGLKALCDECHLNPDSIDELRLYAPGENGLAMVGATVTMAMVFRPDEVAS